MSLFFAECVGNVNDPVILGGWINKPVRIIIKSKLFGFRPIGKHSPDLHVPGLVRHDHGKILTVALEALRQNLDRKLIGFNLLPEMFTMREVQELYEAVYSRPFVITNFQKKILDLNVLERL